MYKLLIISVLFASCVAANAQKGNKKTVETTLPTEIRVSWYNVENFFDTVNDPKINDEDFLPEGPYKWTNERYAKKLTNITKVFTEMGTPSVIGLCEVENASVVADIAAALGKDKFGFVHFDSPDERGIDVALIYEKAVVKILESEKITIGFPKTENGKTDYTRDILHVKANIGGQRVHFYMNHWPSRREGQKESDPKRVFVAQQLKTNIDKVQAKNPSENIVVMGDLNDYFKNNSIAEVLKATLPTENTSPNQLYDVSESIKAAGKGTYFYKGEWDMLDHIIVNGMLCDKKNKLSVQDIDVFKADFMLYADKKSGKNLPSRTYSGPKYFGGYSDHLPILMTLKLTK